VQLQQLQETLDDIVRDVWASFLDVPIARVQDPHNPTQLSEALASVMRIDGAWHGCVYVICAPNVIRQAAARMFFKPEEEIDLGEMQDTVGEIANLLAGYVKSLLLPGSRISLPQPVDWICISTTRLPECVLLHHGYVVKPGYIDILVAE
jgi:CheY-specific phosphatase CheX